MSEPIEISIDPNRQMLRLYCGQCGDVKDIIFDSEHLKGKRLTVIIQDAEDLTTVDNKESYLSLVEIIV